MELAIEACEGGFYIAKLSESDRSEKWLRSICQKHGLMYKANMRFYSLSHIREYFEPLLPTDVWLEHNHAYDEMIGLPSAGSIHRQPLHWYSVSSLSQKRA